MKCTSHKRGAYKCLDTRHITQTDKFHKHVRSNIIVRNHRETKENYKTFLTCNTEEDS